MTLVFYPRTDDILRGELSEQITMLMEAADRYKSIVLEVASRSVEGAAVEKKMSRPRDLDAAFNWEEMARILSEVRELLEGTPAEKAKKSGMLMRLAEVYEVLRAAKMAKLEAVRLALVNEAKHLQSGPGVG